VEVLVRRAEQAYGQSTEDDGFRTILPASSFLTPLESRNEECMSRVRLFGPEKLSQALSQQKWDQFKVSRNAMLIIVPCSSTFGGPRIRIKNGKLTSYFSIIRISIILQVVCTQPFNKRLRYGLNFFTVHASAAEKDSSYIQNGKLAMAYVN